MRRMGIQPTTTRTVSPRALPLSYRRYKPYTDTGLGICQVWRAKAMNLPSRVILLHSRRNCPPYNKARFSRQLRRSSQGTIRDTTIEIDNCCLRLSASVMLRLQSSLRTNVEPYGAVNYKMHFYSYGGFHSAATCPESKCSFWRTNESCIAVCIFIYLSAS